MPALLPLEKATVEVLTSPEAVVEVLTSPEAVVEVLTSPEALVKLARSSHLPRYSAVLQFETAPHVVQSPLACDWTIGAL
jgi:hypothetical protein